MSTVVKSSPRRFKSLIPVSPRKSPVPGRERYLQSPRFSRKNENNDISNTKSPIKSKSIPQLFLNFNGNKISELNTINLSKIRCISLNNCDIKSFNEIPLMKTLRFLSITKNKIDNLKDVKPFPNLEKIDVSGNPIDKYPELIYAALNTIKLDNINQQEITDNFIQKALSLPPLVGYSLRQGRPLEKPEIYETELEYSLDYLTSDLKSFTEKNDIGYINTLTVTNNDGHYEVTCPYNSPNIQWFADSYSDGASTWIPIDGSEVQSIKIPNKLLMHTIKCVFTVKNMQFTLYTSNPVGKSEDDLSLPFPITPTIRGSLIEGSLVSVMPLPVPVNVYWMCGEEQIAEKRESIILTPEMTGKKIKAIFVPEIPCHESIKLTPCSVETGTIKALMPSVYGLAFPEEMTEFEEITFTHQFTPINREGKSRVVLEKARHQYDDWIKVESLDCKNLRYTPKADDVGFYLRIKYKPRSESKEYGDEVIFYSTTKVTPSIPKYENPMIAGFNRIQHPLVAIADYYGGTKGQCLTQWFVSSEPIKPTEAGIKSLDIVCEEDIFIPMSEHEGKYIAARMIPVRIDECEGESVIVSLDHPLERVDSPQTIENPGTISAWQKVRYDENYTFQISDTSEPGGFKTLGVMKEFVPKKAHVGRYLKVVNDDTDAIIGLVVAAQPSISLINIKEYEGGIARIDVEGRNISWDRMEIVWYRCDDYTCKAIAVGNPDYILTPDDVGFCLFASISIFDDDWKRILLRYSEKTVPIKKSDLMLPDIVGSMIEGSELTLESVLPMSNITWYRYKKCETMKEIGKGEKYKLTKEDVGTVIKVRVTINHTNTSSNVTNKFFSTVLSAEEEVRMYFPAIKVDVECNASEGVPIQPSIEHDGVLDTVDYVYTWYRIDGENLIELSQELVYTPTLSDVGFELRFGVAPLGCDKKTLGTLTAVQVGPVEPSPPSYSAPKLKQVENGKLVVTANYFGGNEGTPIVRWFRIEEEEPIMVYEGESMEIVPSKELQGFKVYVLITPVRDDGEVGKEVTSNVIEVKPLPEVTDAEILKADSLLRCKANTINATKVSYFWYRLEYNGNYTLLNQESQQDYNITIMDAGTNLKVEIEASRREGNDVWVSDRLAVEYDVPENEVPGLTLRGLDDGDVGMVGTTLIVKYRGIEETPITWKILKDGKVIHSIFDGQIKLSADFIGCCVQAEDQLGNQTRSTPVIQFEREVGALLKSASKLPVFKFSAFANRNVKWNITLSNLSFTMESSTGTKKSSRLSSVRVSCPRDTDNAIEILMDASSRYVVIPQLDDDNRFTSKVPCNIVRDFIAAVIQSKLKN